MLSTPIKVIPQTESFGYAYNEIERNGEGLLLNHYLRPGYTTFDVGANVGEWSQTALNIEPSIKNFCFEPNPIVYQQLVSNLGQSTAKLYNVAVSDRLGSDTFYNAGYNNEGDYFGGSSFYNRKHFASFDIQPIQVELETLDHFCETNQIVQIDFLKIDAEGAELRILNGATNLLTNQKIKAIQFEYGGCFLDANVTLRETMELLTNAGYVLFRIYHEGLIHISNWSTELENYRYCNYLAITQEQTQKFKLMTF